MFPEWRCRWGPQGKKKKRSRAPVYRFVALNGWFRIWNLDIWTIKIFESNWYIDILSSHQDIWNHFPSDILRLVDIDIDILGKVWRHLEPRTTWCARWAINHGVLIVCVLLKISACSNSTVPGIWLCLTLVVLWFFISPSSRHVECGHDDQPVNGML